MPKPFVRAVLAACVVAGVVAAGATPAAANDGWDPYQCFELLVELPDRAPVVTVCNPPPDEA